MKQTKNVEFALFLYFIILLSAGVCCFFHIKDDDVLKERDTLNGEISLLLLFTLASRCYSKCVQCVSLASTTTTTITIGREKMFLKLNFGR